MPRNKKPRYGTIGDLIHGTYTLEDLIPEFLDAAFRLQLSRPDRSIAVEIRNRSRKSDYFDDRDIATEDRATLEELLNRYAPPYVFFGCRPGSSGFGFYLPSNFAEDFDGLKVNDTADVPTGYSGEVMLVNDHGNVTLFNYSRGRGYVIWAVV
jgi:hypothetical protein